MFFFLIWIFSSITVESTVVRDQFEEKSPFLIYSPNGQVKEYRFQLIPSVGFVRPDEKENVVLSFSGWIYQPVVQRKKGQISPLENMRNPFPLMSFIKECRLMEKLSEEKQNERLYPFFVQRRPNFSFKIVLTDSIHQTILTNNYGQFQVPIQFDSSTNLPMKNDVFNYIATDNSVSYRGTIYLLRKQGEEAGCSIISTIDDTIKVSSIFDTNKWLKSSFENDFEAIPDIAETFQKWNDKHGCLFHYVSSLPVEFYLATQNFLDQNHFPKGSFHPRFSGLETSISNLDNLLNKDSTSGHLEEVLKDFFSNAPKTQEFVFIGNSAQRDPEVFGDFARKYEGRVKMILIVQRDGAENTEERFEKAFKGISTGKWAVVEDVADFPEEFVDVDSKDYINDSSDQTNRSNGRCLSSFRTIFVAFFLSFCKITKKNN